MGKAEKRKRSVEKNYQIIALVYDFGRKTALYVYPMEKALAGVLLARVREAAPMVQILTDRGTWLQEDQFREIEAFGIGMYRDMYDRAADLCEDIYKAKQQSTTSIGAAAPHGCG